MQENIYIFSSSFQRTDHEINMSATSLQTLNMMGVKGAMTEPPCTKTLSGPQLLALKEEPLQVRLPACSVAVERGVKDVTEAALVATDARERDGIVFQKLASRKRLPYSTRNKVWGV